MENNNNQHALNRLQCTALRGIAILGIVLHNWTHWLPMAVKENEYTFSAASTSIFFIASICVAVSAAASISSLIYSLRFVTLDLTDSTPLLFSLLSGTFRYLLRSSATTFIIIVP